MAAAVLCSVTLSKVVRFHALLTGDAQRPDRHISGDFYTHVHAVREAARLMSVLVQEVHTLSQRIDTTAQASAVYSFHLITSVQCLINLGCACCYSPTVTVTQCDHDHAVKHHIADAALTHWERYYHAYQLCTTRGLLGSPACSGSATATEHTLTGPAAAPDHYGLPANAPECPEPKV